MCGGNGSRLFPLSRDLLPKQFLKLIDNITMFQLNCINAKKLNPLKFIIVCNEKHNIYVKQQLKEINIENYIIISEPFPKNTSAAIAAISIISKKDDLLLILTADHIWDENNFVKNINDAEQLVTKDSIVFIGIKPTYPETGYGYIHYKNNNIIKFVEKPILEVAKEYLENGNYLWNSGIFLFYNKTIIYEFKLYADDIYNQVQKTIENSKNIENNISLNPLYFKEVREKSIDYTIMENHKNGLIICYDGYWCDIGSFQSLYNHSIKDENNNVLKGNIVTLNCENNYIESENRLITTIDVNNLVIVDTKDVLMILNKDSSQKVKDIVKILKEKKLPQLISHTKVHRPWGSYTTIEGDDYSRFKVKRIGVYPGMKLSLQSHNNRSEHWVIVDGKCKVQIGKDFLYLQKNQHVYIPKETLHRIENIGNQLLEFIETQIGDYLGEDDIIRYEDDFNRI